MIDWWLSMPEWYRFVGVLAASACGFVAFCFCGMATETSKTDISTRKMLGRGFVALIPAGVIALFAWPVLAGIVAIGGYAYMGRMAIKG